MELAFSSERAILHRTVIMVLSIPTRNPPRWTRCQVHALKHIHTSVGIARGDDGRIDERWTVDCGLEERYGDLKKK